MFRSIVSRSVARTLLASAVAVASLTALTAPVLAADAPAAVAPAAVSATDTVLHRTVTIDGLTLFYREAGPKDAPTLLLLHGFPTSSHMFRDLIPLLAKNYHVIAPDYPGFGQSSAPSLAEFDYTFDKLSEVVEKFTVALNLKTYALYVQDYGAPVGYRLAVRHPDRVTALIVQNGNAYVEGLDNPFWAPIKTFWQDPSPKNTQPLVGALQLPVTKWQYLNGARNPEAVSPDGWSHDQALLDRPGNREIQLALFYDYRTNAPLYPAWQAYFRQYQPPTLLVWGKNDAIFPPAGAEPYKRDLKNLEFHLLNTGHFALEEDHAEVARLMLTFLKKNIASK